MQSAERHKYSTAILRANRRYPGRITVDDVAEIIERSGRNCYWCKKGQLAGGDLTLEHLEPENRKNCIVVSCLRCNTERRERRLQGEGDVDRRPHGAEYMRKWRRDNPDLNKCRKAAETANRRYPGTGRVTGENLVAVVHRCNRTCYWCKKENLQGGDLTFEHLRPMNDPKHIVLACRSCNAIRLSHGNIRRTKEEKYQAELAQKREHNALTAEHRRVYRRQYYETNAEAIKAKAREYHRENKEKLAPAKREYDQKRYQERRAEKIAQARAWKQANRKLVLAQRRANYALKRKEQNA